MATYYVQTFQYTNPQTKKTGSATMYGAQDVHDHNQASQFTPGAIAWIVANFSWPQASIEKGKFLSNQGVPSMGAHQLKWNGKQWVGV